MTKKIIILPALGGGGSSGAAWGSITGDIQDQTDLQTEFATKWSVSGNTGSGLILGTLTIGSPLNLFTADATGSTTQPGSINITGGNSGQVDPSGSYGASVNLSGGSGWTSTSLVTTTAAISMQGGTPDYGGALTLSSGSYDTISGVSIQINGANASQSGGLTYVAYGPGGTYTATLQLTPVLSSSGGSFVWTGAQTSDSITSFSSGYFNVTTLVDINFTPGSNHNVIFNSSPFGSFVQTFMDFEYMLGCGARFHDIGGTNYVRLAAADGMEGSYDLKFPGVQSTGVPNNDGSGNLTWVDLGNYAPLESPEFTGSVRITGLPYSALVTDVDGNIVAAPGSVGPLCNNGGSSFSFIQSGASGDTSNFNSNPSGNDVYAESTWTGSQGGTAYTIGDIVTALKANYTLAG